MFDFRNGMLGVVIITLAIAGSLFAAYFAGAETEQIEVTKYEYLADVSGLFDYDESPQYIDFDPSSNYVGYYSYDSDPYFAENDVAYVPSNHVNNYMVDLEPIIGQLRTESFSSIDHTVTTDKTYRLTYVDSTVMDSHYWRGQPIILSSIIDNLTFTQNTSEIRVSTEGVDWDGVVSSLGSGSIDLDTILIVPQPWLTYEANGLVWGAIVNPSIDASTVTITGGAHNPVQSIKIELATKQVKVYSDANYSDLIGSYDASKILIFQGNDPYAQMHPKMDLSDEIQFSEVITHREYLDPNTGVWLIG